MNNSEVKTRKFEVTVKFNFEVQINDGSEWIREDRKWGYIQVPRGNLTLDNVKEELSICLDGEFARDEAGLSSLPKYDLTVIEKV